MADLYTISTASGETIGLGKPKECSKEFVKLQRLL